MTSANRSLRRPVPVLAAVLACCALAASCDRTASDRTPPSDAAACLPTPAPAVPAVAALDASAGAAGDAVEPAGPVELAATLVLDETRLVADRRFAPSLKLENPADRPAALHCAPDGDAPAGAVEFSRDGDVFLSRPLSGTAVREASGAGMFTVPARGQLTLPLPALHAPTACGPIDAAVTLRLVDDAERSVDLRTPTVRLELTWEGLSVLHIGDSLVAGGLTSRLAQLVHQAGGRYRADGWVSSNAPKWLGSDRLTTLLRETLPDIVLVTLGTNEYEVDNPDEYADWYGRLAQRLGHRRCFWIGPPRLPGVDPFVEIARNHTTPCPYFDSRDSAVPNAGVHRDHLTKEHGAAWADAIWAWLGRQGR